MFDPNVIEKMFMKSFKIAILNKVNSSIKLSSVGAVLHLRKINTPDVNDWTT